MLRRHPSRYRRFPEYFKRRRRYGDGSGGGLASGEVGESGGVYYGFTDFSEFDVGAGLPTGLTLYGTVANQPSTIAIANDVTEGNYITMDGHASSGRWGMGVDAFDALIRQGEILARIWIPNVTTSNTRNLGCGMNMDGLTAATYDHMGGAVLNRTNGDQESFIYQVINGAQGEITVADIQEAEQYGAWAWHRFRKVDNETTPANDDLFIKTWFGDIADEPVSFDIAALNRAGTLRQTTAIGWGTMFSSTSQLRVSYFSFTGDPTAVDAPEP